MSDALLPQAGVVLRAPSGPLPLGISLWIGATISIALWVAAIWAVVRLLT